MKYYRDDGGDDSLPLTGLDERTLGATQKAIITGTTARICVQAFGDRLYAIVLTGSMARQEATLVRDGESWTVLGDAEFLLIFRDRVRLPAVSAMGALRQKINVALTQSRIACVVGLSPVQTSYLRKLPPSIFAYELRTHGEVTWGDSRVLSLIPAFSPSKIPLEDAWRLLCNRMIELLDVTSRCSRHLRFESRELQYTMAKLYLDMATSLLVFLGAYQASYRERNHRLTLLAEHMTNASGLPFTLQQFSDRVDAATRFKLQDVQSEVHECGESSKRSLLEAVEYARYLWRWELARLTGVRPQMPDRELIRKWMQFQPLIAKVRGWAYVWRQYGWVRSFPLLPRWLARILRASPRYGVYAAASELFFALPYLLELSSSPPDPVPKCREIRSSLPVAGACEQRRSSECWQKLASEIGWNYREFLQLTRA